MLLKPFPYLQSVACLHLIQSFLRATENVLEEHLLRPSLSSSPQGLKSELDILEDSIRKHLLLPPMDPEPLMVQPSSKVRLFTREKLVEKRAMETPGPPPPRGLSSAFS